MLLELNRIIIFSLFAFFMALVAYPFFIALLKDLKMGKSIREDSVTGSKAEIFQKLHSHKAWTPTMGGGLFLIIMAIMILVAYVLQYFDIVNNSLVTRQETYILLFAFFGMGAIGIVDDWLNIKGFWRAKGMGAKVKLISMFAFAGFVSYRFFMRLGISTINFWPIAGVIDIGRFYPVLTFFMTLAIVNAINITDWLDWLAGWLMIIVLGVLAVMTFIYNRYIATTLIWIILAILMAFLWFNIAPAQIFMGDSGALGLGGLLATLVYLLNIKVGVVLPFMVLFMIFWAELLSSFLQIFRKKVFHKKLFSIAPLHHLFEHRGNSETNIVMRMRLIQWILAALTLIFLLYQINIH